MTPFDSEIHNSEFAANVEGKLWPTQSNHMNFWKTFLKTGAFKTSILASLTPYLNFIDKQLYWSSVHDAGAEIFKHKTIVILYNIYLGFII